MHVFYASREQLLFEEPHGVVWIHLCSVSILNHEKKYLRSRKKNVLYAWVAWATSRCDPKKIVNYSELGLSKYTTARRRMWCVQWYFSISFKWIFEACVERPSKRQGFCTNQSQRGVTEICVKPLYLLRAISTNARIILTPQQKGEIILC